MVGSTRFSLRSSLLALGTSMRHGKRANSFSGDIDLMDEDSPFCSSSVPAKIDRTDCVLTSAEFTSQIHAHSCTVEELIPRQSLPIVQMMDSSSSSDDDNDAEISSDTDEKQSKNVQLPNDRGSGNTNREEHDDGLIGENKQQDQTSIPYGDNHNNVQTTCHESDLSSGGTIAECNDEDNAMQHEPSNRCHVEQNPAGDTFRDEDCESQPVCTEGISTRETFDNEGMQDDVQTAVVEESQH
ncbi:expressed unknown protein [Seminavis robusta]|uniref:Uncharacterized protein n=1 Tax=Seminavis robusta TaxID=568900 RepID=A0A9N8I0P1_9STRA|nr:expressed unknown protein [Seminavis robusta]|eukprot:Sro2804_g337470.1 n/a (241) ;mRNA; r:7421-8143